MYIGHCKVCNLEMIILKICTFLFSNNFWNHPVWYVKLMAVLSNFRYLMHFTLFLTWGHWKFCVKIRCWCNVMYMQVMTYLCLLVCFFAIFWNRLECFVSMFNKETLQDDWNNINSLKRSIGFKGLIQLVRGLLNLVLKCF